MAAARPPCGRASTAILIALLAPPATACSLSRPAQLAPVARALGATIEGNACSHSAYELTARTLAAWKRDPQQNPYAAEFRCLAIEDNLTRDGMSECAPAPEAVLATPQPILRRITGDLWYLGIDPREYSYDLAPTDDQGTEVVVRIQFKGALTEDARVMDEMRTKLALAAALWTRHSPDPKLRFRFVAETDDTASPHFVVDLRPGTPRTPFDVTWGSGWSAHLMAHEIGHMMGLDDEYGQIRKTIGHMLNTEHAWDADPNTKIAWFTCDLTSLMCDSKGKESVPQRYHYYMILRRRFCRTPPPDTYPRF